MPLTYEMKCLDCQHKWTASKFAEIVKCPHCGSYNVRIESSPYVKRFIAPSRP